MSSLAAQTLYTPEEYLALERKATVKSEYLNGKIRAMPRVNFAHNFITVFRAAEDVLVLASIGCELPLREIYRRVPEVIS